MNKSLTLGPLYKAWALERLTSLLSLDVTKAFSSQNAHGFSKPKPGQIPSMLAASDKRSVSETVDARMLVMLNTAFGSKVRSLMEDPKVVELMLNPDGKLWVEKLGEGMYDSGSTLSPQDSERIIRIVASSTGVECNEKNPSLAASLPGSGARFQGFLPPVVRQPSFTIRKKAIQVFLLEDYVRQEIMSQEQADFIKDSIQKRQNILVVGGTGTGKTTLANAVLAEISKTNHRIVTIEDTPELQCTAPNLLSFFTNPPVYTMQYAIKDALRSRPDRIVVGEVRDGSALDLLKGWNTGHNGGIATIHANGAIEGLTRMEQLILEVSVNAPSLLIAQAVDLLIHIERYKFGRRIGKIARVTDFKAGSYVLEDIV